MHGRRGVLLLERSEFLSFGAQAQSALRQTRDVGAAFWTLLVTQTWLTVFTCVMTIISIAFFSYGAGPFHLYSTAISLAISLSLSQRTLVAIHSKLLSTFSGPSNDIFPLDLSYIGFLIILPCLLCMWQVIADAQNRACACMLEHDPQTVQPYTPVLQAFSRREAALHDLSQGRT